MRPYMPLSVNHKSKIRNQKCFTLIELLVVVAIIAVLVAMLLPSLVQARERARAVQCLANLRQVGAVWGLYWNSHNDYIPPMQDWWNWGGTRVPEGQWWPLPNLLLPEQRPMYYLDDGTYAWLNRREYFLCPSDNRGQTAWSLPNPIWWHVGTSYANNPHLVNHPNVPRRVTGIPEPSRLIFLGDTTMFQAIHYPTWVPGQTWHDATGDLRNNILFFDGHAGSVSITTYPHSSGPYQWFPDAAWY